MVKKRKFPEFLKAKGFYISLLTGICALCVICVVYVDMLNRKDKDNLVDLNDQKNQTEVAQNNQNTQVADNSATVEDKTVAGVEDSLPPDLTGDAEVQDVASANTKTDAQVADAGKTTDDTAKTEKEPEPTVAASAAGSNLIFDEEKGLLWPIAGNIIMNYNMSSVIYFQTLDQWKCNPAIIIEAEVGDEVKSAANGIVTDVSSNEETGNTITVAIGNGYNLTYGQLSDVSLKVGDTLEEGDVIGKIAEPTKYYVKEGSNLYFKVMQDEDTVNPMLLLR